MDDTAPAPASLEDVVADLIETVADEGGPDLVAPARAALDRRRELLAGADPDKAIRAGAALARLSAFGAKLRNLTGVTPLELETMGAEAMRDELARDLTYAINAAGEWAELEVLERAQAIRALTEAYVRLGGELELELRTAPRAMAPGALPPIVDNEELIARIWRRLNEGPLMAADTPFALSTAQLDAVVTVVRAELERPALEEREAQG